MDKEKYEQWLALATEDLDVAQELRDIQNRPEEIHDRFYCDLAFGTGGMRGKLGAGSNRMNIYTVRRVTKGLADFLLQQSGSASVAIAYDSRRKSRIFALETARVLSACGVTARIFERLMPTPMLSYAVRRLGCSAGVMITASHNPADYNGYKVYGADGCQITEKTAMEITRFIERADPFAVFGGGSGKADDSRIAFIPRSVEEEYYNEVLRQRICEPQVPLSIVYTPLNGTGYVPVTGVLARAGFNDVTAVSTQKDPDPDFPTCPNPNPELPEAFREGLWVSVERKADLLLATDPDCDRVGVAVRHQGEYKILSGNEVGALLLEYICRIRLEAKTMSLHPVAIKTIVTSELAEKIAAHYGVCLRNVLTGFKYIGEEIGQLEAKLETDRFIFGFEESCGYLSGAYVRDKDAVNACLLICDMAAWYKSRGYTLADGIGTLYRRYGYCISGLASHEFGGESGAGIIRQYMQGLRDPGRTEFLGRAICGKTDYLGGASEAKQNGLPLADVVKYELEDGTTLIFRPSGTEPKLKIYCTVNRKDETAYQVLDGYIKELKAMLWDLPQCMT